MKHWRYIALHTVARRIHFLLQRYALNASLNQACCGR